MLVPWQSVTNDPSQAAGMARELARELSTGHPLYGLPVQTLARRQDCDDVLFAVEDGSGRVAVVHLTWSHSPPERPPWPGTVMYPSLEAWVAGGMREFATSLVAASVLCHLTGGLYYDPQEGNTQQAGGILAWAREQLAFIEKEIE